MKTNTKNLFLLPALIAGLNLIPAGRVTAQTFTTLHSFTAFNNGTNSDGAGLWAGLITNSSGNTLYGTAYYGGSSGYGTVFAVHTDGAGFTNLHSFTAISGPNNTNSDGAYPTTGLLLSGNTLYGTAPNGGSSGNGTVFAVGTDGSGFTNLHSFTATSTNSSGFYTNSDGANPYAGLILSSNTLYGTAGNGGRSGVGTVFKLNTIGTGFTTVHHFTGGSGGGQPYGRWVLSGNTLYGTSVGGGSLGTVFALNTDGTGFRNLHSFDGRDGHTPIGLILSGNTLYGTTQNDDIGGFGTVFKVNTNGTGFTTLHLFGGYPSDGANPASGLIVSGNTVYGTAGYGGSLGKGTVFAVNTDGTGITNLHNFTDGSDGGAPIGGLIISGNTLYGTAYSGGSSGNGTVFSLSFPLPQLTITPSGVPPSGIILSWPVNVAGFDYTGYTLQSATNLSSPVAWSSNLPAPVVIAGQNTVTNPITGAQQFFRLVQ